MMSRNFIDVRCAIPLVVPGSIPSPVEYRQVVEFSLHMMPSGRAFKITLFLADGTPAGIRIVEKSNWIGRATVCPRPRFASLKDRPEWGKPGVYLLAGDGATDDMPKVYIGQGERVGERLVQHERGKEFWSRVVFFTSKDDNLNKATFSIWSHA